MFKCETCKKQSKPKESAMIRENSIELKSGGSKIINIQKQCYLCYKKNIEI